MNSAFNSRTECRKPELHRQDCNCLNGYRDQAYCNPQRKTHAYEGQSKPGRYREAYDRY